MVGGVRLLSCGRLAVRAVFSASALDLGGAIAAGEQCVSPKPKCYSTAPPKSESQTQPSANPNVVATCAGFPKDILHGPSNVLDSGVYGDDACFISRFKNSFVVGVADGVGGWRKYGIDPSKFSRRLMKECEKRVISGEFEPKMPEQLLSKAFKATQQSPRPVGSSTACILVVHQEKLYTANLGDSGFMIIRDGKVLAKSKEQVHYFNAPFQLTQPPEDFVGFIGDTPESAEKAEIPVQKGDIIVLATDGLWDNVSEQKVIEQLRPLFEQQISVQEACNALALTAHRLAFDETYDSPFAQKAREHGHLATGGKPDDVTLILLLIA